MATVHAFVPSPVGDLLLQAEEGALTGLYFTASERAPAPQGERGDDPALDLARVQLAEYFARERETFDLLLTPRGTPFQRRVWEALARIPYGVTRNYGEIAAELGNPKAVRAVGLANGQNPLSIVVPCHRVLGADGRLVGYGGGIERKRLLLDLERGFA